MNDWKLTLKQYYFDNISTGMTQRDGLGREVGGGSKMGNTCTPVAHSCRCMAKPYNIVK